MNNPFAQAFPVILLIAISLLAVGHAQAFEESDFNQIQDLLKITPQKIDQPMATGIGAIAPRNQPLKSLMTANAPALPREQMINGLDASYMRTLEKCEGRFDLLVSKNERQIKRSEWIAIFGGTFGVIGTIATCPHCAAAMSGLAGLANPLQATLAQNNDTPQTTQARLTTLANKIGEELDSYKKLPPPNWVDSDKDFYTAYRAKVEQLQSIASSCLIYSKTYTGIEKSN